MDLFILDYKKIAPENPLFIPLHTPCTRDSFQPITFMATQPKETSSNLSRPATKTKAKPTPAQSHHQPQATTTQRPTPQLPTPTPKHQHPSTALKFTKGNHSRVNISVFVFFIHKHLPDAQWSIWCQWPQESTNVHAISLTSPITWHWKPTAYIRNGEKTCAHSP